MANEQNGMAGLTNAKKSGGQSKPQPVQTSISQPPEEPQVKTVKRVTYLTRWNLFAFGMVLLFSFLLVFAGLCIPDTTGGASIVSVKNPLALLRNFLGWRAIAAPLTFQVANILVAIYIALFAFAFVFEYRYAIVKGLKVFSLKMIGIYLATLILCVALSFGLGLVIQAHDGDTLSNCALFLAECLGITAIIYVFIGVIIVAILLVVVNFIRRDKPLNLSADTLEEEEESHDIASSLGEENGKGGPGGAGGGGGGEGGEGGAGAIATEELAERELVFPALSRLDKEYGGVAQGKIKTDDISLIELCNRFRNYLCKTEKLYYDIDTIRVFISGMAASHLEILEGLSGTGKSSLPRYFARFVGGEVIFLPVQATWRDKSSLLGYFNDFSKTYRETDVLLNLYDASYNPDKLYMFVLDEMNISRIEYYFADFLSIFEYPPEDWLIPLMQVKLGTPVPRYIEGGKVRIPTNTWFIGTANTDDSTFTITDKVYDRAIVIEFKDLNLPFTSDWDYSPYPLTMAELTTCINEAMTRKENNLTDAERTKFMKLTMFIAETFDLAFGNRIMNQIDRFVPVFVALGGTKEAALDLMLSRKILRKLDGHFESFIKNGLVKLTRYLQQNYGKGVFKESEALIEKYNRKLS